MSNNEYGNVTTIRHEYYRRQKILKTTNRIHFLKECLEEQVLPKSAPKQLRSDEHPFSASARSYIEEGIQNLQNRLIVLKDGSGVTQLPSDLVRELNLQSFKHRELLKCKLARLCDASSWKNAGNKELINNLSSYELTTTEREALSLGLKFSIGRNDRSFLDIITSNYHESDNDVEKGFKQGMLACFAAAARTVPLSLPRRYFLALQSLGKNADIFISTADKGGGVVIIDTVDYLGKMQDLLSDDTVYKRVHPGTADSEALRFNKEARRILKRSEKGKGLLCLLEDHPVPPRMRGLPKTHKAGVPMRPITSGIGSAPHRLAKRLAVPLSGSLGSISGSHLKNSGDLLGRIKELDVQGMGMASFDVKSLFTNVSVSGALEAARRVVDLLDVDALPIPKRDFMKLVSLCLNFGFFTFNGEEFKQVSGLAMGSPLSAVLACLYMETLEEDHFKQILGEGSVWLRYVDDVLVFVPDDTDLDRVLNRLNSVEQSIQFTIEREHERQLPFLDVMINRERATLTFSVYRKPTNKDDMIHFYSGHSMKTKTGVALGFFLRAYRICSPKFIGEELGRIIEDFRRVKFPLGVLIRLKHKAKRIYSRNDRPRDKKEISLTLPNSHLAEEVRKVFHGQLRLTTTSGLRACDMVQRKPTKTSGKRKDTDPRVVYKIPCGGCNRAYFGESGRGIEQRIKEHKADLRYHRTTNSFVMHVDTDSHLPDWCRAETLHRGLNKRKRRALEAAYITTEENINISQGYFKLSKSAARLIRGILDFGTGM